MSDLSTVIQQLVDDTKQLAGTAKQMCQSHNRQSLQVKRKSQADKESEREAPIAREQLKRYVPILHKTRCALHTHPHSHTHTLKGRPAINCNEVQSEQVSSHV